MVTNDKLALLKSMSKEIKVGVIVIDLLLTVYVLWLIITDTSTRIMGELFGYTPFGLYLLWRANEVFCLCWLHKMMLLHSGAVYLCCVIQSELGFGDYLWAFRWIMFVWGVLLYFWLCMKKC